MSEYDWRLWLSLFLGVVSLLWSIGNTIFTFVKTKQIRDANLALEEFKKSVRDPIFEVLSKCEDVLSRVDAIAASGKPFVELTTDIETANRDAIDCLSRLGTRLDDANTSTFVASSDWLQGFDLCEDKILACFNEACNAVNPEHKRRDALARVYPAFRTFRSDLRSRLETEVRTIAG